jgi:drug/metabolite transporter (DMT)-like permease
MQGGDFLFGGAGFLIGRSSMNASSLSFRTGVLFVLAGMVWGLQMGISNDHAAFPAHAHLNLLGFVSLFLFGFYYRMHPSLDRSRIARAQVGIWIAGTIVMAIGVALVHTGRAGGDPIAAIGSIIVLGAMLTFAWLLFKAERQMTAPSTSAIPAE